MTPFDLKQTRGKYLQKTVKFESFLQLPEFLMFQKGFDVSKEIKTLKFDGG